MKQKNNFRMRWVWKRVRLKLARTWKKEKLKWKIKNRASTSRTSNSIIKWLILKNEDEVS